MRFFNNNKIKYIIIKNYEFICSRFFVSIFFAYIISCVIHVVLIKIFLHKFYCIKQHVCINNSEIMMLSLQKVDRFLCEKTEKQRSSNILRSDDQTQKLKFNVCYDQMDKNKDSFSINKNNVKKNTVNTDLSSSFIIPSPVNNIAQNVDFFSLSSNWKRDMNFNNNNNKICVDVPRIIDCTYPEYPNSARILGIKGHLVVKYNINSLGKVENIRVLSANPVGVFDRNVRIAMRRWLYESNQPKKDLIITFKFCLKNVEIFDAYKIR